MKGAKLLVLGIAYKKDVDDLRESPALTIIELLEKRGAELSYHDPHIPELGPTRHHALSLRSVALEPALLKSCDAVLIVTDHSDVDYAMLLKHAPLVIDTRNVLSKFQGQGQATVVKA